MKSLLIVSLLSLSVSAFAGLQTNQAILTESQGQNEVVSTTELLVTSQTDMVYDLQTTASTRWSSGAQLLDVKGLILNYASDQNGGASRVDIYQVDGNNMGSIQTNLMMNCSEQADLIRCSAVLPNNNKLVLAIGR